MSLAQCSNSMRIGTFWGLTLTRKRPSRSLTANLTQFHSNHSKKSSLRKNCKLDRIFLNEFSIVKITESTGLSKFPNSQAVRQALRNSLVCPSHKLNLKSATQMKLVLNSLRITSRPHKKRRLNKLKRLRISRPTGHSLN
jgi:hypothetical protein